MIYTVTLSPSLDLKLKLSHTLVQGKTYRAQEEELRAGGKGINISVMLKNLGVNSTALGFVAGFSGDELMRLTMALGIHTGFVRVRRGRTRINVRLNSDDKETKINGLGPQVSATDIEYLHSKIKSIDEYDYLILAGMVPPSLPQDIYTIFVKSAVEKRVKFIVDVPADVLHNLLPYRPFLIKPNLLELQDYLQEDLDSIEKIKKAAFHLQDEGAQNILVSLGQDGAIFISERQDILVIPAPGGMATDKTGAGDSMIAGFVSEYNESHDLKKAAIMAVATGSATATTKGLANKEQVQKMLDELNALHL